MPRGWARLATCGLGRREARRRVTRHPPVTRPRSHQPLLVAAPENKVRSRLARAAGQCGPVYRLGGEMSKSRVPVYWLHCTGRWRGRGQARSRQPGQCPVLSWWPALGLDTRRHGAPCQHTETLTTHHHNIQTLSLIMNLSMDSGLTEQQQQPNRQNLNLLLLHQMYQPLASGESKFL